MSRAVRIQCEKDDRCGLVSFRKGGQLCIEASSELDCIPVWFSLDAAIEICDELGEWIDQIRTEKRQQVREAT